jgi:hypothetical protein
VSGGGRHRVCIHEETLHVAVDPRLSPEIQMKRLSRIIVLLGGLAACGLCSAGNAASQSVIDSWPVKWCEALPDMTRVQLVSIMGKPTLEPPQQMTWSSDQYRFTAFLNADGTARQLDYAAHSQANTAKSAPGCAALRTKKSMLAAKAIKKPDRKLPDACTLVTAAEMSAILKATVIGKAARPDKCIYKPAVAISPYAEFSVDVGEGRAAMRGAGMTEEHEPGITSPYEGIGDQAVAAGPALLIRSGEDLVTIVLSGVPNAPAAAKRIFETAKQKM